MNDIAEQTHSFEKGGADASISASATTGPAGGVGDATRVEAARERRRQEAATGEPDVLLDVADLSVDEIDLEVSNLRVHLALNARLANLLHLSAGAEARIDKVSLTIKGVRAEALLKVRLDNVADIINRTLATVDRHPQIIERMLHAADSAVGAATGEAGKADGVLEKTVDRVANGAEHLGQPGGLLTKIVDRLGHTIEHVVDRTGNLIENVLDRSGNILRRRSLGSIYDLPLMGEFIDDAGRTVRRLRDSTGAVLELTEDQSAGVGRIRVVSPPGEGKSR